MISRLARLRAKKGFTLIELIVVIAVIGILTTIVVASLSYDNKPIMGKAMAKDLFYIAQDAMSSSKITEPDAISDVSCADGEKFGYYINFTNAGEIELDDLKQEIWGTIKIGKDNPGVMPSVSCKYRDYGATVASDATVKKMGERMLNTIKNYISTQDNMAGTVIVLTDNKFRIVAAYWTNTPLNEDHEVDITSTGFFEDNNILNNGYYFAAYPARCSLAGKYVFNTKAA